MLTDTKLQSKLILFVLLSPLILSADICLISFLSFFFSFFPLFFLPFSFLYFLLNTWIIICVSFALLVTLGEQGEHSQNTHKTPWGCLRQENIRALGSGWSPHSHCPYAGSSCHGCQQCSALLPTWAEHRSHSPVLHVTSFWKHQSEICGNHGRKMMHLVG